MGGASIRAKPRPFPSPSYESELGMWRSGREVPEDEQKKFGDSVRGTPYSSPQGTPTKSFSPTPQDFQEERIKLNGLLEEKVSSVCGIGKWGVWSRGYRVKCGVTGEDMYMCTDVASWAMACTCTCTLPPTCLPMYVCTFIMCVHTGGHDQQSSGPYSETQSPAPFH